MVAISSTLLVGFAALAIDMSMLYGVRTEAQRAADAGALAGAWKLLGNERLQGSTGMQTLVGACRQTASSMANQNKVFSSNPTVDQNGGNSGTGDVVLGRLTSPSDQSEQLNTAVATTQYNSVKVLIHRDSTRNGPIDLIFGQVFGFATKGISASAVATAEDAVIGFKNTGGSNNPKVMPIAVDVSTWQALLAGTLHYGGGSGDSFNCNTVTSTVTSGSDGIPELNIFPGGGGNQGGAGNGGGSLQLTPGNWGTLNIPTGNNSTAHLGSQIEFGLTVADLAGYPNGEFKLGADGTILVSGDPGMSNGIKDNLAAIIGQARSVPLYTTVTGNGNNTTYRIVGFAGVRIMAVRLTGNPGSRYVLAQPAVMVDRTAVTSSTVTGTSYNVYKPPTLVR